MKNEVRQDNRMKRFGVSFDEVYGYNLYCGYVQRITANGCKVTLDLWYEGCWHIRYCNYDKPPETNGDTFLRRWISVPTLTQARKQFNTLLRTYQKELKS